MATQCAQCAAPLAEGARFCGQCGTTQPAGGAAGSAGAAAPQKKLAGTMLAFRAEPPPATVPDPSAALAAFAATPDAGVEAVPPPPAAYAPMPPAPVPAPAPPPSPLAGKGTMIGVAVPDAALAAARAQLAAAQAAAMAPTPPAETPALRSGGGKTMLGVAIAVPQAPQQAPAPTPEAPAAARRGQQTMLGVAIPGIAPSASTPPPPPAPAPAPAPVPPPQQPSLRGGGTMLGVAIPGIAPTAPGAQGAPAPAYAPPQPPQPQLAYAPMPTTQGQPAYPQQPGYPQPPQGPPPRAINPRLQHTAIGAPIVPAPPPFVDDEPLPEAPPKRASKGIPIGLVAAIVGGLVLLGGGAIALFYRGAPPLVAQPRLDAQGNEVLHLKCENCPDGTIASLDGAKATFQSTEADLALTKPLDVGDNKLAVHVERPGVGRDETANLVVPVAFRIRADLADIDKKPPVITVRVAAAPGTDVKVDAKPLSLDASGKGAYAVDVSSDAEGATEELRVIDRKIPYVVTLKGGKPESGVVSARIAVAPLRLDAPSTHAVIDSAAFTIAGQTAPGGSVMVDDKPIAVQPDGSFADTHAAGAAGAPVAIEVRASAPGRAPRTAHVTVKRAASLDAEAKAQEAAGGLLTYDQIAPDIASKAGQRAVVSGEVLESRVNGHQTIALVNDVRGCKSGPCLARVIAAEDAKGVARGSMVRAYGTVTRAVSTSTGKTIPEIEADFVARGR